MRSIYVGCLIGSIAIGTVWASEKTSSAPNAAPLSPHEIACYRMLGKAFTDEEKRQILMQHEWLTANITMNDRPEAEAIGTSSSLPTEGTTCSLVTLLSTIKSKEMRDMIISYVTEKKLYTTLAASALNYRVDSHLLNKKFDAIVPYYLIRTLSATTTDHDSLYRMNEKSPLAQWGIIPVMRVRALQMLENQRTILEHDTHTALNLLKDIIGSWKRISPEEQKRIYKAIETYYEALQIDLDYTKAAVQQRLPGYSEKTLIALARFAYLLQIEPIAGDSGLVQEKEQALQVVEEVIHHYYNHPDQPIVFLPTTLFKSHLPEYLIAGQQSDHSAATKRAEFSHIISKTS